MLHKSLPVCFLFLGAALCTPEHVPSEARDAAEVPDHGLTADHVEKRSPHYNFGLGKRAYSYVSEYKRLPVYNFGLGKRSRPYSFGLGKRSVDEREADEVPSDVDVDLDQAALNDLFDQYEDAEQGYDQAKRARPYSFGLGKRVTEDERESPEEKRARYDFGLGKRLPLYSFGLGKRARSYSFGLGKRQSRFNFGLGKRQRDLHRFSFGIGKRSGDDVDESDNYYDV